MFIRKFGQEYHQICVTDSYHEVHDNYDKFDEHTGLHSAYAMESFGDAVTKIASSNGTIIVEKTVLITADLSLGSNIDIDIRNGGSFAVSDGITLTILGELSTNGQLSGAVFTGQGSVVATARGNFNEIISGAGFNMGGSAQDIYSASVTKKFPIGTRRVVDERVFRYCKAGAGLSRFIGGFNNGAWPINGTLTIETVAGSRTVSVPDASCAVNAYAGGYIALFTSPLQFYRILSNTVSDGAETILTIDTPLKETCAIGTWATGYASPYADLRNITSGEVGYGSVLAVPIIDVTDQYYFWGQTWGPCYAVADGTVPGITAGSRHVFWAQSGNIEPYVDAGAGIGQFAGYLIPHTSDGSGDQFFMLTLSP